MRHMIPLTLPLRRLYHHSRVKVHHSLQARTVALVALVALAVAVVFSVVSTMSVRSSLLNQVTSQSRSDFSNQVVQAQNSLDSADVAANVQYQQLVNDLASSVQNDGSSNLEGVYIWGRGTSANTIIPVSTEPTYAALISDDMRSAVASGGGSSVFYQPVQLSHDNGPAVPGAVLGTVLRFGAVGDLEFFSLYSYANQQRSLSQIQVSLLIVCVLLSMMTGLLVWLVMRGIVTPVQRVATAAETLASGDLDARVTVDRSDEVGTLQRSFNEMADSLNQKIDELEMAGASQRRFVSDVSHELRTPVTTMRMASDLLESRKDGFDTSTKRTVELLSGQIGRFQDMLADLLEISRYDAGYAALDLMETDVREPVRDAVEQVLGVAQARQVTLDVALPPEPVLAGIDSRRITRIVRNLLVNAVDFAKDRPIEVRLAANRKAVVISVRDYGVGMSDEQVGHVFDRFWRGDPSRSRTTGGSGLGLSIAMADVRLHHGSLRVRSHLGEGTWFLVALPKYAERYAEDDEVEDSDLPIDFTHNGDGLCVTGEFGVSESRTADGEAQEI